MAGCDNSLDVDKNQQTFLRKTGMTITVRATGISTAGGTRRSIPTRPIDLCLLDSAGDFRIKMAGNEDLLDFPI